jgi:hypothetical protein
MTNIKPKPKFKRCVAHAYEAPEYVICKHPHHERWIGEVKLEAYPMSLRGQAFDGRLHHQQLCHPTCINSGESFLQWWHPPRCFILRRITVICQGHISCSFRIAEKSYYSFDSQDGLSICGVGEEYERGISIFAPTYFAISTDDPKKRCAFKLHGIILREIC